MPFTPPSGSSGQSGVIALDEGSTIGTATVLNFTGVGGTASFSNGTATVDVPGVIVYDEGTVAGTVTKLNFTGAGVVGTVSAGTAVFTITGGTVQPTGRGAKVYKGGTQVLTTSVDAAITYDQEEFDTGTYHDTGSNTSRIVLGTAGYWRLTATHMFAQGTGGRFGYFTLNGTALRGKAKIQAAVVGETWLNYTTTVKVVAGTEWAEAWAIQVSGGNLNVVADSTFEALFIGE